jgi:PAS domain S-box-containing protein
MTIIVSRRGMSLAERAIGKQELIKSIRLSPIASIVTDPKAGDNPIIAANSAFEQLTGYCEDELIGRNCRILAGPETDSAKSSVLRQAVATASALIVELVNYRKDGTKFLNAIMIAPVLNDERALAYFVGSQMEVDQAQTGKTRASAKERVSLLTPQQQTVLRLMARGLRNRQIGAELGLTEKTIKMHRGALVKRLGVTSSVEALRLAVEAGF